MNLPSDLKKLVAGATFTIRTKEHGNGQCVLVEGGLIITAAHCVDWDCSGGMAMGDFYLNTIKTGTGNWIASTLAVEPVSDIAVLGRPDDQEFSGEAAAFDELCKHIVPVSLLKRTPKVFKPFPVWIRTHRRTWVAGTATYFRDNPIFSYETKYAIQPGTSGGPIVNRSGRIGRRRFSWRGQWQPREICFCRWPITIGIASLGVCKNAKIPIQRQRRAMPPSVAPRSTIIFVHRSSFSDHD